MTSKERVQAILSKKRPDRTPIGFFAIDSDTASRVLGRETYWRAKAKTQIAFWEGRRDEVVESLIADGIELYKKLDLIDIIPVCCMAAGVVPPRNYTPKPPRKIAEDTWEDREGRIYKYSSVTKDITIVHDPQMWTREHKVSDRIWEGRIQAPDESIFEVVDAVIAAFKEDRFVLGPCGHLDAWLLLGGMERGLMEIAMRPGEIRRIYETLAEKAIAEDAFYVREGQDGVLEGTDLASTAGPMINPLTYRELFLTSFQKRIAMLKNRGQRFFKHACGNNWKLLDLFTELGIDCYQSIQTSAGMDLARVHELYSDKFVIWGGVQVEHLIEGTVDDIRREVDFVMREIAPSGRFILGTSHSVAVGTKYENFMALLDQFSKWI